ncbi:hypothetical protein F5880DRAFT_1511385 [Lentinula raphanica]|nr:hypothetical protein F5880DRAFT_1511385 [Lentinula raphanica]
MTNHIPSRVRNLNFSLATFIDNTTSWIGQDNILSVVYPARIERVPVPFLTVEPYHSEATTTRYGRSDVDGELFFDMFGSIKNLHSISNGNIVEHVAFVGATADSVYNRFECALFESQLVTLKNIQLRESILSLSDIPLLYSAVVFPFHPIKNVYIENCFTETELPLLKVIIDKNASVLSLFASSMLQTGSLSDNVFMFRCILYREDKITCVNDMHGRNWQLKRSYVIKVIRIDDLVV